MAADADNTDSPPTSAGSGATDETSVVATPAAAGRELAWSREEPTTQSMRMISISTATAKLSELVRQTADEDVVLMNHGRPAAVLVAAERYDALLDEIEDLHDRLSIHERDGVTTPLSNVIAELGLSDA